MSEQTTALATREPDNQPPAKVEHDQHEQREQAARQKVTEARSDSISATLDSAYKRASELKLTAEEAQQLAEDFPDDAFRLGAGGDENLVYLEHAFLRERLNRVLGVGAAVPIRRREWAEEFTYMSYDKYDKRKPGVRKTGVRLYVDMVLLVRGCFVAEAVGDHVYYPDNAKTTYSDALEAAKSNAIRRCCKEFGIGLQVWKKGWTEDWKRRTRTQAPQDREPQQERAIARQRPTTQPKAQSQQQPAEPQPEPTEPLAVQQWAERMGDMDWRDVKIHFGKQKEKPLGDLDEESIRWWCEQWMPKPHNGCIDGASMLLRQALEVACFELGYIPPKSQPAEAA